MTHRSGLHPLRRAPALTAALVGCGLLAATAGRAADSQPAAPRAGDVASLGAGYKGWEVASLSIEGVDDALVSGLKDGLAFEGRVRWFRRRRPPLSPSLIRDDMDRIQLFMARHGHPFAEVTPGFHERDGARRVDLTFRVDPGPEVTVSEVVFDGVPDALAADVRDANTLHAGMPFEDAATAATAARLAELLRSRGYADVGVDPALERTAPYEIRLRYRVAPGPRYTITGVDVRGAPDDLTTLSHRVIGIRPGTLYSPKLLADASDRLQRLGLFRRVRLRTVAHVDSSGGSRGRGATGTLDVIAELTTREYRTWKVALGYVTDEGPRARASWQHRNLLGGGRAFAITGGYSSIEQSIAASVRRPAAFGPRTSTRARIAYRREDEESFRAITEELEVGLTYQHSAITELDLRALASRVDLDALSEEIDYGGTPGVLSVLSASALRNTVGDRLSPSSGTRLGITVDWTLPGALSDNHFLRVDALAVGYLALGESTVLVGRARSGQAFLLGDASSLIPSWRFFAGGARSMRGFRRNRLGPLDADNAPLGGEALVELGAEVRRTLIGRFDVAAFIDAGQVFSPRDTQTLGELEAAVGPALIVRTPIGPARLDVGFRLTDVVPDQPESAIHVSIGHPF